MDRPGVRRLVLAVTVAVTLPASGWAQTQTPPAPQSPAPQPPPPAPQWPPPPDVAVPPPAGEQAPPAEPPPVLQPPQPIEGAVPATVPSTWGPNEPEEAVVAAPARGPIARPRLSAAIGFGGSFDSVGFAGGTEAVPEFVGVLGIGDGLLGLDVGGFASSATRKQRQSDSPVDRVSVDLYGVVRPGALHRREDRSFEMRVLHSLAAEAGLGLERAGRSNISGTRFLIHLGATVDLPLTPANASTELRFRLGVRRNIGLYAPKLYGAAASDVTSVGDTALEVYGALAFVF